MYFVNTESLEIVMEAPAATTNPSYVIAYNDIQSTGMVLPQSSSNGLLTGTTPVTVIASPASGTTRQVAHFTLHNSDTATVSVIIRKDVSGTDFPIKKAILPSGATIEYSRETGWNVISSSSQLTYVFSEYVANGTWTKPKNIKLAWVVCIAGGGGGGSGRTGVLGSNRTGGGGGAGGGFSQMIFDASQLSDTPYSIVVGTGGLGGASQTSASTNGNPGGAGGNSSFGTILLATGGGGGGGGTNSTSASAGSTPSGTTAAMPAALPYSFSGGSAGGGFTNSTSSATTAFSSTYTAGGAGGTGLNTSNAGVTTYVVGTRVYVQGALNVGTMSPLPGRSNVNAGFFMNPFIQGTKGVGEGGAGATYAANSSNGTDAGNYGSGGGGGLGVTDPAPSGAGGNGAGGLVVILEMY